jgi:small basic protein
MQFVRFYACDQASGALLPGAAVEVFLAGTQTLAALFDNAGEAIANPATSGNQGQFGFAAADGDYDVVVTGSGGSAQPSQRAYLFDPADLAETVSASSTNATEALAQVAVAQQQITAIQAAVDGYEQSIQQATDAANAAAQAIDQAGGSAVLDADALEDAAEAALNGALQQASQLFAEHAANFTTAGLPIGPFVEQQKIVLDDQVSIMSVLGEVTSDGSGFVLNSAGVYYSAGVLLSQQIEEMTAATASVSATLTTSYLTASQTNQAIAAAETTLQASINGVSATLTNNYLTATQTNQAIAAAQSALQASINGVSATLNTTYMTSVQVNGAITTAVSAAQTTLQASINSVSSNLSTHYFTTAQTNAAITAAQTSLQASINGVSSNLTSNYMTSVQVSGAITTAVSAAQTTLQNSINGVSSNLSANYLTGTQVNGAISTAVSQAQTTLQASINTVSSNLSNNYLTTVQTNGAITTAVSAAQLTLQNSINGVSATLTNNYMTTTQTTQAIAAAEASLQASINGVSATLTNNYLTAAQTNQAIASAQTTLQAAINGVSATVSQQAGAISTLQGQTTAYLQFSAATSQGGQASVTIVAAGATGTILLTGNVIIDGNVLIDGSVGTAQGALGAFTTTAYAANTNAYNNVYGSKDFVSVGVNALGGAVQVTASISGGFANGSSNLNSAEFNFYLVVLRDGGQIMSYPVYVPATQDISFDDKGTGEVSIIVQGQCSGPWSVTFQDTPAAGAHTYDFQVQGIPSNTNTNTLSYAQLTVSAAH